MSKALWVWVVLMAAACTPPVPGTAQTVGTTGTTRTTRTMGTAGAAECVAVAAPYVGTLCTPGGQGRHAAIAFFGGYGGDEDAQRLASEFAGRGYVTSAVSYFGVEGTPDTLVEVPVETGIAAVTALAARKDVDAARVSVMGTSKGGEYALLVASHSPLVKAVIANVPSPFGWFGLGVGGAPTGCSWAFEGQALPCVPADDAAGQEVWQAMSKGQPVAFRAAYEAARRNEVAVERAFFPIERIRGPVLCLAAGDDQVWNSAAQCELAIGYLRAHQHPFADRTVLLPGAGHLYLLARGGPGAAMNSAPLGAGGQMAFGGSPEADASAARTALVAMEKLLEGGE